MFRDDRDEQVVVEVSETGQTNTSNKVRVASFFAGIGGFDRAFELEGARVVFHCEKDRYCRSVLRRHWPKVAISDDIRVLEPGQIPDAEVWTAGFPCQDVSLARGNHGRTGLKGNHTSLFFKLAELVAERRPTVLLLENVVGLLNSHGGQDFAIILRELTTRGYAVSWRVMNARYFGAPQSRPRVFLCAWRGDFTKALETLFEETAGQRPGSQRAGFLTEQVHEPTGAIVAQTAYCVSATSGRHTGLDWSRSYVSYGNCVRRPTPTESERLQGFPENWTIPEPTFKEPARGFDSERYRAAGNAVAVPVVRWIAKRLQSALKTGSVAPTDDFTASAIKLAPDLARTTAILDFNDIEADLAAGNFKRRWRSGGCAVGKIVIEGDASPAPAKAIDSSFVNALDPSVPDDRYFLTANAAKGILRRADALGRNLFPPMRRALEILAEASTLPSPAMGKSIGEPIVSSSIRAPRT